eukprot:8360432-Ditylum_brightwellii.AAC.1
MNKKLCHGAKTSLLHAMRKWQKVITTALWPYCYKTFEERHNHLDLNHKGLTPIKCMLAEKEEIVADDFHTWGCPVM